MVNEATQRMTIEAISKENNYSKHYVNYFQSWDMGTTNRLLQTALQEQTAADNLTLTKKSMMTYKQMFSEESDDDNYF